MKPISHYLYQLLIIYRLLYDSKSQLFLNQKLFNFLLSELVHLINTTIKILNYLEAQEEQLQRRDVEATNK